MIYLASSEKLVCATLSTSNKDELLKFFNIVTANKSYYKIFKPNPYEIALREKWGFQSGNTYNDPTYTNIYLESLRMVRDALNEDDYADHHLISTISSALPTIGENPSSGKPLTANNSCDGVFDREFSFKTLSELREVSELGNATFYDEYMRRVYPDLYELMHSVLPLIEFTSEKEYSIGELHKISAKLKIYGLRDETGSITSFIPNAKNNVKILTFAKALPSFMEEKAV